MCRAVSLLLSLLVPLAGPAHTNRLGCIKESKETRIHLNNSVIQHISANQLEAKIQARAPVDSFFIGKNNVKRLSAGKDNKQLLIYFKNYLELKDKARADTVSTIILKADNSNNIKYNLSLTYYKYSGTTEVKRLFLSPGSDIKKNRDYLLARRTKEIKGQNDMLWAHYYNLVQLDSAYSRVNKSDSLKIQMGQHCNSLAWSSLLTKQAKKARYYLNKSIKLDPQSKYFKTNYPHVLLFNGAYVKARKLYLKYKDLPFDTQYPTYKDVFLEDFEEFKKAGLNDKHLQEMTALLTSK